MPTINLSPVEIRAFQHLLREHEIEVPEEGDIPSVAEYAEDEGIERARAAEQYDHQFAEERLLRKLGEACPVCGKAACDRGVAYIGSSMVHADQHPERQAERARERRAERRSL